MQCFDVLLSQLRKNHSQIRLAAMQVTHELFMRSSVFRARAVDCLRELVELGVGSADEDLPPPKRFAKMLLKCTVRCVCAWEQAHGKKYLQLTAAISHIAHLHNVSCKLLPHLTFVCCPGFPGFAKSEPDSNARTYWPKRGERKLRASVCEILRLKLR